MFFEHLELVYLVLINFSEFIRCIWFDDLYLRMQLSVAASCVNAWAFMDNHFVCLIVFYGQQMTWILDVIEWCLLVLLGVALTWIGFKMMSLTCSCRVWMMLDRRWWTPHPSAPHTTPATQKKKKKLRIFVQSTLVVLTVISLCENFQLKFIFRMKFN